MGAEKKKALVGQNILIADQLQPAALLIEAGRIAAIEAQLPNTFSGEVTDCGTHWVLPGLVDSHVHINEPGRTEWEGFATATQAAAAGGITTVIDMPLNCSPVTTRREALETKLAAVADKLYVDTGFWGGAIPQDLGRLDALLAAGVLGAKSFTIDSGLDEFPPLNRSELIKAAIILAKHKLPFLIHAELQGSQDFTGPTTSYDSFLRSRPPEWEIKAIEMMLEIAQETGVWIHIVHLSTAKALPLLQRARNQGLKITVETCPHYLILNREEIETGQTLFKCCPPIRERQNSDLLWQGLAEGVIDMIVSDHSPCTAALKALDTGDFKSAWGGISSLQWGLHLIFEQANARGLPISDIARWMSKAPAHLAGLQSRKGAIKEGLDADLVIFDPRAQWELKESSIRHRNKGTPYLHHRMQGAVLETWLRGEPIFRNGDFIGPARGATLMRVNGEHR